MFDLVNDVEAYPRFMPGCVEARVISRLEAAGREATGEDEAEMVAELCLAKAGVRRRFTTRNRLQRPRWITMKLERGDLRRLDARWEFQPLGEAACRVSLHMEFEAGGLWSLPLRGLLSNAVDGLVDALIERAGQLYG